MKFKIAFMIMAGILSALPTFAQDSNITIDTEQEVGKIYNFWSTRVVTSEHVFDKQFDPETVKKKNPFAQYYNFVRFLGGRHDDKYIFFKGISENGGAICDFTDGINFLKKVVGAGYTPRIVLDNVPIALMSEGKELNTYGNTEPSKDLIAWHSYVKQFIQALIKEFGKEQVKNWRFRVGTEPDLNPGHWTGTEEQYMQHYDWTVDAVTSVLGDIDIGPGNILSPHESKFANKWGINIIEHCAVGRNYKTGKVGTRMTFFAYSWYGKIGRSIETLEHDFNIIKYQLDKYPQFANVSIEIQEFSVLQDVDNNRIVGGDATEWTASWMAAISDKVYKLGINQIYQWGTTSPEGTPNPKTHVLYMLQKMQGLSRLKVTGGENKWNSNIGCLAGRRQKGYDLILYRHEPQRQESGIKRVKIKINDPSFSNKKAAITEGYIIDRDHDGYHRCLLEDFKMAGIEIVEKTSPWDATVYHAFGNAGRRYFLENYEKYKALSELDELSSFPEVCIDGRESRVFEIDMGSHSVIYLKIVVED